MSTLLSAEGEGGGSPTIEYESEVLSPTLNVVQQSANSSSRVCCYPGKCKCIVGFSQKYKKSGLGEKNLGGGVGGGVSKLICINKLLYSNSHLQNSHVFETSNYVH